MERERGEKKSRKKKEKETTAGTSVYLLAYVDY